MWFVKLWTRRIDPQSSRRRLEDEAVIDISNLIWVRFGTMTTRKAQLNAHAKALIVVNGLGRDKSASTF